VQNINSLCHSEKSKNQAGSACVDFRLVQNLFPDNIGPETSSGRQTVIICHPERPKKSNEHL